ncbi:hypothetical protein, partial [Salmonella sp. s60093]|uniref:hypothetical protein n=1 Tax=Salmonella sp. s60093 TaxID=3159721 RepID=UPI003980D3BC
SSQHEPKNHNYQVDLERGRSKESENLGPVCCPLLVFLGVFLAGCSLVLLPVFWLMVLLLGFCLCS